MIRFLRWFWNICELFQISGTVFVSGHMCTFLLRRVTFILFEGVHDHLVQRDM